MELLKIRVCIDGCYVNLWMRDCLFSFDKLIDVLCYVFRDLYFMKCDDKFGYGYVCL